PAPLGARKAPASRTDHLATLTTRFETGEPGPLLLFEGDLMTRSVRSVRLGLVAAALCALTSSGWAADDQPWVLDANNWQEGKDLLPEPVVKRLKDGQYWFKVSPVDPKKFHDNYSKKFWDATAANAGKYDVEPKQCGLMDKATGKIPDF